MKEGTEQYQSNVTLDNILSRVPILLPELRAEAQGKHIWVGCRVNKQVRRRGETKATQEEQGLREGEEDSLMHCRIVVVSITGAVEAEKGDTTNVLQLLKILLDLVVKQDKRVSKVKMCVCMPQ